MPTITKKTSRLDEVDMAQVRQSELNAAQDEFWKLRQEISNKLDNLTLVQLQKVNEKVRETVDSFDMNQ